MYDWLNPRIVGKVLVVKHTKCRKARSTEGICVLPQKAVVEWAALHRKQHMSNVFPLWII